MTTIYASGHAVPRVDDSKNYFKGVLTILYGPSGSGKSSLVQHILNTLRDSIPLIIVCCPTASLNGDYNGIVPEQCIYDEVNKPLMQRLFQRQTNVMAMYDLVRNVDQIKSIYALIADNDSRAKIQKLTDIYRKGSSEIKNSCKEDEIDSMLEELKTKYNKKRVKIMRGCINAHIDRLNSLPLTEMQRSILTNFNINPRIMLLFDDVMHNVSEWSKWEETKKLFFQARHFGVACCLTAQSITLIPPQLRSNAHVSIFTTQTIANEFVSKATSGIPNDQRKMISKIAAAVFAPSEDRSRPNYKKLVIFGQIVPTEPKIQYIIGSIKKKRFGSAALWHICEEVKRDSSTAVNSTSFSKMFALKAKPALQTPH